MQKVINWQKLMFIIFVGIVMEIDFHRHENESITGRWGNENELFHGIVIPMGMIYSHGCKYFKQENGNELEIFIPFLCTKHALTVYFDGINQLALDPSLC